MLSLPIASWKKIPAPVPPKTATSDVKIDANAGSPPAIISIAHPTSRYLSSADLNPISAPKSVAEKMDQSVKHREAMVLPQLDLARSLLPICRAKQNPDSGSSFDVD